jgi:transcriptional regulator with XRE-family HTH domain
MSQGLAARGAGIQQSLLNRLEHGKSLYGFTLYKAWRLAQVLRLPLEALCQEGETPLREVNLSQLRIHQLLQAVAQLPDDAQELLVSTALELQGLLQRHGRAEA